MIKMEQKRRIKDGNGRDMKNVKGKAVIEIAIAVVRDCNSCGYLSFCTCSDNANGKC
jgi:hypothetical protein